MRIHEITYTQQLNEAGIIDLARRAASGIAGGAKAAVKGYQQGVQTRQTQEVANKALKVWTKYAESLKAAVPNNPDRYNQLYRQALLTFVQKNLLKGTTLDQAVNKQELVQAVDAITASANNPQQLPQLFSNLVQQAAVASPDIERGAAPLVRVLSADPALLSFRNRTYMINDQGQWADQQTNKVPDESFQAFLDQELAKVERAGYKTQSTDPKPAAQQPAQPAQQPAQAAQGGGQTIQFTPPGQ